MVTNRERHKLMEARMPSGKGSRTLGGKAIAKDLLETYKARVHKFGHLPGYAASSAQRTIGGLSKAAETQNTPDYPKMPLLSRSLEPVASGELSPGGGAAAAITVALAAVLSSISITLSAAISPMPRGCSCKGQTGGRRLEHGGPEYADELFDVATATRQAPVSTV